jgi:phage gp36-like protein
MAYSTFDDVRVAVGGLRNLVELADIEYTAATFGSTPEDQASDPQVIDVVTRAIAESDGIINGYLKQRHAVPLATPTDEIKAMSASWSARVLRRNKYKQQPIQEDLDAEKIAREYLGAIANGTIQLGIEPTPEKSSIVIDKAGQRDTSLAVSARRMRGFI